MSPKLRASEILFSIRNMASQEELGQVGIDVVLVEPMVQDDTPMQEDIPPQPNPEVVLEVAGAAHEHTPCAISPMDQIMQMMRQLVQDVRTTNEKMDANAHRADANTQALRGESEHSEGKYRAWG